MGQPRQLSRTIESPPGVTRPWTPPHTDTDLHADLHAAASRDGCFVDSYRRLHVDYMPADQNSWPHAVEKDARCDTPTEDQHQHHHHHHHHHQEHLHNLSSNPQTVAIESKSASIPASAPIPVPSTPTSSPYSLDYGAANQYDLPRYPYTPDSSCLTRHSNECASSPLSLRLSSSHASSPVQNALSSCIAHFENLLQARQPDEDQMEYIVGQFEAMAACLSAPDAQSRDTDEHLFAEPENSVHTMPAEKSTNQELNEAYMTEVGRYIQGVRRYVADLKMRMDEVKMLNSIQSRVIQDLVGQVETVKASLQHSPSTDRDTDSFGQDAQDDEHHQPFGTESTATLVNPSLPSSQILEMPPVGSKPSRHVGFDSSHLPAPRRRRTLTIVHRPPPPPHRSFWSSFAEALDSFGNIIFES